LKSDSEVVLRHAPNEAPDAGLGFAARDLWEKGVGVNETLTATALGPGLSVLGRASYEIGYVSEDALLPRHAFALNLRLDYEGFCAGIRLGYGFDRQDYDAWGYRVHALVGEVRAGYGWDLGPTRLSTAAAFGLARLWQKYDDGESREGMQYRPAVVVGLLYPANKPFSAELSISAGPTAVPGNGTRPTNIWRAWVGGGLAVGYRFK